MESKILSRLGFDPGILVIILLILVIAMGIFCFIMYRRQSDLLRKYKTFMRGRPGKSLEESLQKRFAEIDNMIETNDVLNNRMRYIETCTGKAFQKIGVVKYDAFKEIGGKLSFALTLLNEENTGIILNSIHSREGNYIYIKEIIKGNSFIALNDEENESLQIALQSHHD